MARMPSWFAASTSVISVSDDPTIRAMVDHAETIVGKKVFTDAGDEQGSISDIYFDEPTGAVVGYEVSAGLFGDVRERHLLPFD